MNLGELAVRYLFARKRNRVNQKRRNLTLVLHCFFGAAQGDQAHGSFSFAVNSEKRFDLRICEGGDDLRADSLSRGGSKQVGEYRASVPVAIAVATCSIFPCAAPEDRAEHDYRAGRAQR